MNNLPAGTGTAMEIPTRLVSIARRESCISLTEFIMDR